MAVRVETLGGIHVWRDVDSGDRVELRKISGKPVRCAVLTCVAVERDLTRERLLDLLWPEYDPKGARHNLSQTLVELGRDLGPGIIERHGERLVATPELNVDALEFENAVAQDSFDEAGALYSGSFLDAVHLKNLPGHSRIGSSKSDRHSVDSFVRSNRFSFPVSPGALSGAPLWPLRNDGFWSIHGMTRRIIV